MERVLHLGPINGRLGCDVQGEERIRRPTISGTQVELQGAQPPLLRAALLPPMRQGSSVLCFRLPLHVSQTWRAMGTKGKS